MSVFKHTGGASGKSSPLGAAVSSQAKNRPVFGHGSRLPATVSNGHVQRGRLNLRAVAEVLSDAGMDPAEELVKIVQSGKLPPEIAARILNELLQYTQPKLKSVEVRAKVVATAFDINDDQAKRIAEEFLRGQVNEAALLE